VAADVAMEAHRPGEWRLVMKRKSLPILAKSKDEITTTKRKKAVKEVPTSVAETTLDQAIEMLSEHWVYDVAAYLLTVPWQPTGFKKF
jgi:hypothetical protein